ncbi:MAG TPA: carbohydrate ABC transporter permease, partial [Paenibacillus sp.]|nr:carbohydrate ABC transporter permease [Paenibacillus sp.]
MVNIRKIGLFDIVNFLLLAFVAIACLFPFLHMASVTVSAPEYVVRNEISFFPRGFQLDALNAVLDDPRL